MKLLIAAVLTAALIWLTPANQNIHNSTTERTKVQAVQAEAPRKEPTLPKEQEKALTKQTAVVEPEAAKVETPAPQTQGCEQYRPLVQQYAWDSRIALAVMQAESGCNPNATSPTADRGLMQVNAVHIAKVDGDLTRLYDPVTNIRVAYSVYLSQGWQAWTVWNTGRYLAFL